MNSLVKLLISGAFIAVGQAAFAQTEHEVWIERRGFFPATLHVQEGDTIRYINKTPNWVRLWSYDANDNYSGYDSSNPCANANLYAGDADGWSTGWFYVGAEIEVSVTACMETTIMSPEVYNYSRDQWNYRGYLEFQDPDLGS